MNIKRKFLIYLIIFIAAYAAIIIFIIIPTINDIRDISRSIYNERVDLERKYLRGQLLKKTIKDFEKIKPQEEKLSSIFVKTGQELELITLLEDIANKNQVDLKINLKTTQKQQKIPSLTLEIKIEGNYLNTLSYLNDLERLNYYFNVENLQISTYGQESTGSVKLSLVGNIYTENSNPL